MEIAVFLYSVVGLSCFIQGGEAYLWPEWWSYKGVTGPNVWSHNSEWEICNKGKHQSPVNIDPKTLLFDPKLKSVKVDSIRIPAQMINTGQDITVFINGNSRANITAGPLSYHYRVEHIKFHFGDKDDIGSEHIIGNKSFAAEMQIFGYNTDLYRNFSHATQNSQGIAAISVFIEVGENATKELTILSKDFIDVRYKDWNVNVSGLSVSNLLPQTEGYMTYEGSLTQPGCQETVTWILMNKPIYILKNHLNHLRKIRSSENTSPHQWFMVNNRRPVLPLFHRAVRTNINFPRRTPLCNMERVKRYKVNNLQGR